MFQVSNATAAVLWAKAVARGARPLGWGSFTIPAPSPDEAARREAQARALAEQRERDAAMVPEFMDELRLLCQRYGVRINADTGDDPQAGDWDRFDMRLGEAVIGELEVLADGPAVWRLEA